jgi:glycosyltransferase involved in cell wall biosynthesis
MVAVVSEPRDGEHPFVAALVAAGVTTVSFALPARAYMKERALIKDLCEREKPDVVHTHGYRPDILHAASRLRRQFATVTTLHGSSKVGGRSTFHELLQLFLLRRFDAVIAVSRELAETLRGKRVAPERLHLIPNAWSDRLPIADALEARRFLGLPAEGIVVGWVGRLIPIKGADVLLDAARHLKHLPMTISLIGEGPERPRLESLVRNAGLSDKVRFHGSVPDAARYMRAFDVFVLSSRSEGTPITLLEAIAARVPVVATTVGGVPDVVGPAEAMLVPAADPPRLAEAIRKVIENRVPASARVDAAAKRLLTNFNMDRWLDAHDEVYRDAISRRNA